MQYHFAAVVILTSTLVCNRSHGRPTFNTKANEDVFKLLLSLYKLNPLKSSKVYKTFSENILSHGEKINGPIKFESSEGNEHDGRTLQKFNDIENVIHRSFKHPVNYIETPQYDVEDVNIENFNVNIIVSDEAKNPTDENKNLPNENDSNQIVTSNPIHEHNFSYEKSVTKLEPVNNNYKNLYNNVINTQLYPVMGKPHYNNRFNSLPERDSAIQEVPFIKDNEMEPDVVVL